MYYYKLYYGSSLLRDSREFGDYFDDEEEAMEEAEIERDSRVELWQLDDGWHEWDSMDEFDIVIEED